MVIETLKWDANGLKPLNELINDIIEILKALAWSDSKLATKSGVEQSTVSRILSGETANPAYKTIENIIAAIKKGIETYNKGI